MIMIQLACTGSDWGRTNPFTNAYRQNIFLETIIPFEKMNSQRGNVHPVWALSFKISKSESGGGSHVCAKGIHACASSRSLALYSRLSPTRCATFNAQTWRARKFFGASPSSTSKIGVRQLGVRTVEASAPFNRKRAPGSGGYK